MGNSEEMQEISTHFEINSLKRYLFWCKRQKIKYPKCNELFLNHLDYCHDLLSPAQKNQKATNLLGFSLFFFPFTHLCTCILTVRISSSVQNYMLDVFISTKQT